MLRHNKPATQGRAEKELQNKGKGFYFGENFTNTSHSIPGDAESMISKLSLAQLMALVVDLFFFPTRLTFLTVL